jgi:N-formylglutamate deformylase
MPASSDQIRFDAAGKAVADTDWNLDRLYGFLAALDVSVLAATHSRYVIDLNRAPDDRALYPSMRHTGLVPTETFDGMPLYGPGDSPDPAEVAERHERYWRPYHAQLAAALAAIRQRHGCVVLFDCHSIRSVVPRYAADRIADFNLGTADLTTCAPELRRTIADALVRDSRYSLCVDGLFKGGFIPRHYAAPGAGIHAFQLELSMATYMRERPTPVFDEELAERVRPTLRAMLEAAIAWASRRA